MKNWRILIFSILIITNTAFEAPKLCNKIVAIVNNSLIFKSDIDEELINFKLQSKKSNTYIPDDKTIRDEILERKIMQNITSQIIKKNHIIISEQQLNQMIEKIAAQNNISLGKLRTNIINMGINYDTYRNQLREKIQFTEIYNQEMSSRITIFPQEINMMVKKIISQANQKTELKISQILLTIPENPTQQQINNQKKLAYQLISELKNGTNFNKITNKYSTNASFIKNNGKWNKILELPSLFTEKLNFAKKGDIIGPLQSGAGFYILKIDNIQNQPKPILVNEIRANYITLKTTSMLNDKHAHVQLKQILADIKNGKINFVEAAKKFSINYHIDNQNNDYDWNSLELYDPKYQKIILKMRKGEISQPIYSASSWNLIQLLDKRQVDKTNEILKKQAYDILLDEKLKNGIKIWMREQRGSNYVNILYN